MTTELDPFELLANQLGMPRGTPGIEMLREYERRRDARREELRRTHPRRVEWITPGWAYQTVMALTPEHEVHELAKLWEQATLREASEDSGRTLA